jgi:hypothetical protein
MESSHAIPIDVLKIDQSFVRQISQDSNDSPIVTAIIDMGRNLKQHVIAEGIETQEQLAFTMRISKKIAWIERRLIRIAGGCRGKFSGNRSLWMRRGRGDSE